MDIKKLIIEMLEKKGEVRSADIIKMSGFSRAYVNRFFRKLREEGVLVRIGKANKTRYIPASKELIEKEKKSIQEIYRILKNKDLNEDEVLNRIRKSTGIFHGISDNVSKIFEYAFTEMLNNAIEHSRSEKIEVLVKRRMNNIFFEVKDRGIGIFNNIMKEKHLEGILDAIQELLKGKQTTQPAFHSGEGIFFTSRVGDILTIESSKKKIIFDNLIEDIFLKNSSRKCKGTRVIFSISLESRRDISDVFRKYTDDSFVFSKTEVTIKMYAKDASYVSRSQARRLLSGLEKFKTIILDFKGIDTVGQGFADEIFHVWSRKHSDKNIKTKNAVENVMFMIKRAKSNDLS
jgi:anti-sigma regulatory factor (Ser/Thr protein kinase)/transposase